MAGVLEANAAQIHAEVARRLVALHEVALEALALLAVHEHDVSVLEPLDGARVVVQLAP